MPAYIDPRFRIPFRKPGDHDQGGDAARRVIHAVFSSRDLTDEGHCSDAPKTKHGIDASTEYNCMQPRIVHLDLVKRERERGRVDVRVTIECEDEPV